MFQFFQPAHVKWFSQFTFFDKPLTLTEVLTPTFYGMALLSVVVIGLFVVLDQKYSQASWALKMTKFLEQYQPHSLTIMRAAAGAVLLLSFQSGALFVPELEAPHVTAVWAQFLFAILLIFPKTVWISGLGLLGLYVYGMFNFGWFHMMDYLLFTGVGYYLLSSAFGNEKARASGLVYLYFSVGLSLCWVATEKMLYPQWALYLLEQHPQLALGLNFDFFLISAAFIEFSLGFLMIICLLQRPLALTVTVVFFLTSLVFGKTEVIGHTMIHAALIVFVIEGPGKMYKAPITFHSRLPMRVAFACVNFCLLLFLVLLPYQKAAMAKHKSFMSTMMQKAGVEVTDVQKQPKIELNVQKDSMAGWNLEIETENFKFAPGSSSEEHREGEGHAHLYINGKKNTRLYGQWHYLSDLPRGESEVKVTLNTNDHRVYLVNGKPVEATLMIINDHKDPHQDHG